MSDRSGQELGSYHLLRLLGRGGFAEVYLGQHIHLHMQAAIKVLHAHLAAREIEHFQQEAQTIVDLAHPHIVRLLNFAIEGNVAYLVMEYAPGGSLRTQHLQGEPLSLLTALSYVQQMASALQYAHEQHLIHRDVKPENMLVGPRGQVLLSDFGIATTAPLTNAPSVYQGAGGTYPYMAPEQILGKPNRASDQYALAICAYEWLTGERPFKGTGPEMVVQHLHASPPPLREKVPTIPRRVEQVVLTALAKDPKERFATIEQFAHALHTAILETPMSSPKTSPTQSPPEPREPRVFQPVPVPPGEPPPPALQPGTSAGASTSQIVHAPVFAYYDWRDPAQAAINRRGQFTPEQQAILDKAEESERTVFRGWIMTLFITTPLVAFLLALTVYFTTSDSSPFHLFWWVLPVISFAFYAPIIRLSRSGEARMRDRIAARHIDVDDGLIVWKGRYVVQLSTGQLKRNLSPCDLLPGPYRCYHLAKESVLLSAEPISHPAPVASYLSVAPGATHKEQAVQLHQKAFCDLFSFSFDDLISNRQGMLSEKQIQVLAKERSMNYGSSVGVILIIGLGMIVGSILYSYLDFLRVIGAGVTLAAVVAAFFLPIYVRKYTIGLRKKRVEHIEGIVLKRVEVKESATEKKDGVMTFFRTIFQDDQTSLSTYSYFYDIGGLSFPVTAAAHEALFRTIRYRIFYLPKRSRVVSIEPLEVPRR